MNELFIFFAVSIGFALGFIINLIWEMESKRKAYRTLTMGLDDFDIKCINEEYAKRKKLEQEGRA